MIDAEFRQALANIGCKVCLEQLGCCMGGPPTGLAAIADLIFEAIDKAGFRLVKKRGDDAYSPETTGDAQC